MVTHDKILGFLFDSLDSLGTFDIFSSLFSFTSGGLHVCCVYSFGVNLKRPFISP